MTPQSSLATTRSRGSAPHLPNNHDDAALVSVVPIFRKRVTQPSTVRVIEEAPDVSPPLQQLVMGSLGSVTFVGDYVQLDFHGPRLSLFVWPRVEAFGETRTFGDAGYRDHLVGLIGRTVVAANESAGSGLVVRFEGDASLVVNPEPQELQGPEIALLHLNGDDRSWMVWRPGEGCFAGRDW